MTPFPSDLTWLYTVRNGRTVRVRFDLRQRVEVGTPEPWSEPASKVNDEDGPVQSQRNKRAKHSARQHVSRRAIMREIEREAMVLGRGGIASPLTDYVMMRCGVTRETARTIIRRARRHAHG